MNEPLGKLHFALTIVTVIVHVRGAAGARLRRACSAASPIPSAYAFLRPLMPLNRWSRVAAFVMGAAQLLFVVNFFYSLWRGPKAPPNPWEVGTLEWTLTSPPPHHNFAEIPRVLVVPTSSAIPR